MQIMDGIVLGDEDGKNKGEDSIRFFDSYKYGDIYGLHKIILEKYQIAVFIFLLIL